MVAPNHETNLLSPRFFRRDQIWFTEKDQYGLTDLYWKMIFFHDLIAKSVPPSLFY